MGDIIQSGNLLLRKESNLVPVKDIKGRTVQSIISEMKKALDAQIDGVALAAPQIGKLLRIFIVSARAFEYAKEESPRAVGIKTQNLVFINPEIIRTSRKKAWMHEGCLSVRNIYGKTNRAEKVTVTAYDNAGRRFTRGASGLLAQIFQHEIDHLNGILFIDHAKELEKIMQSNAKHDGRKKL